MEYTGIEFVLDLIKVGVTVYITLKVDRHFKKKDISEPKRIELVEALYAPMRSIQNSFGNIEIFERMFEHNGTKKNDVIHDVLMKVSDHLQQMIKLFPPSKEYLLTKDELKTYHDFIKSVANYTNKIVNHGSDEGTDPNQRVLAKKDFEFQFKALDRMIRNITGTN